MNGPNRHVGVGGDYVLASGKRNAQTYGRSFAEVTGLLHEESFR
jgi:hypothetical protein